MNTLKAEKRDMAIKAKRLRREGYVPVMYSVKKLKVLSLLRLKNPQQIVC